MIILLLEMIKDILPIFQVNKIKIIVTEDSDYENTSDSFHNVKEINLPPFTNVQVSELIDKSYNKIFPKEELKKIILLYADLLPGSIESFIRDCLQLNIINYKRDRITIDITDETAQLLKSSHDQIYDVRLSYLSSTGIEAAKMLSLFELNIDETVLSILLKLDKNNTSLIIEELRDNNILHSSNSGTKLQFTSEGLKKHVYSIIERKNENHLVAGKILIERHPNFDRNELARQFELGEDYDMCYNVLKEEIKDAERMSAYSYEKGILKRLQQMPLNKNKLFEIELELSRVLQNLNESNACLELTEKLLKEDINESELELLIQKGKCQIAMNNSKDGKNLLENILFKILNKTLIQEIKLEIANANFNLSNYSEAEKICMEVIQNTYSSMETIANAHNLIAIVKIYNNNDFDKALEQFQYALESYKKLNLKVQIVKMEINIGNIYNIKGEPEKVEYHWNKGLEINSSIGNLTSEALLTSNYGIYYYNRLDFDNAIHQYSRAYDIYFSLGNYFGEGLALYNLGETYLLICEYHKCRDSLEKSKLIFERIKDFEEIVEVFFILGKLYFSIGDFKKLHELINQCITFEINNNLGIKNKNYINYLKQIPYLLNYEMNYHKIQLKEIGNVFLKLKDVNNYIKTYLLTAEYLINFKKFDEAIVFLDDTTLKENSENRRLFEAERLYLLGKIYSKKPLKNDDLSIDLFNKAFNLIRNEIITELTWKILIELAEYYSNRGNYSKVKEYIGYTKSVISYIAEKIEDRNLHETYLNSKEKQDAYKRLQYLELQMT